MANIAFVFSDVALVVPNVFSFLMSCRRVPASQVLAPFPAVLSYIALIFSDIALIFSNVVVIVANVPTIMPYVADIVFRISIVHRRRGNLGHR
jgi:hypothetical protein